MCIFIFKEKIFLFGQLRFVRTQNIKLIVCGHAKYPKCNAGRRSPFVWNPVKQFYILKPLKVSESGGAEVYFLPQ